MNQTEFETEATISAILRRCGDLKTQALNPAQVILVMRTVEGTELGRIPATSTKASAYMRELALEYRQGIVTYEQDPTGGILAAIQ